MSFLSVQFVGNKSRWSRSQKNKSSKPLCLRKNKKTEYFYISILTSVSSEQNTKKSFALVICVQYTKF